jgi:hypothetical protein
MVAEPEDLDFRLDDVVDLESEFALGRWRSLT